jgi:hypothetical protein
VKLTKDKGAHFDYQPDTRLHSILKNADSITYAIATRKTPNKKSATRKPLCFAASFLKAVEHSLQKRLTIGQEEQLLASARNAIGSGVTDTPIRQAVYFGNNMRDQKAKPVYGLLASYDDEMYIDFWKELELGSDNNRKIPLSEDTRPLEGQRKAPPIMVKMLCQQLAAVQFGPQADFGFVPEPPETRYTD